MLSHFQSHVTRCIALTTSQALLQVSLPLTTLHLLTIPQRSILKRTSRPLSSIREFSSSFASLNSSSTTPPSNSTAQDPASHPAGASASTKSSDALTESVASLTLSSPENGNPAPENRGVTSSHALDVLADIYAAEPGRRAEAETVRHEFSLPQPPFPLQSSIIPDEKGQ